MAKLTSFDITRPLLRWLVRFQPWLESMVRISDATSTRLLVLSEVPSGSQLGFIFLINVYVNGTGENLLVEHLLFADDTKIYGEIPSLNDRKLLQLSMNKLVNWCSLLLFIKILSHSFFTIIPVECY